MSLLVEDDCTYPAVHWQTRIVDLIPDDFVLSDSYATQHTTIEDAISHRTGLSPFDLLYFEQNRTVQDVVRMMRYVPFAHEFRDGFTYSSLMYTAVSHVLETLTGTWLGDFLKRRLWAPSGMNSTYFSLADAQQSGKSMARGYAWSATQEYVEQPYLDYRSVSGAGNAISNVLDLAQWLSVMIDRTGPMSPEGHVALLEPRSIVGLGSRKYASTNLYALGWNVATYRGERIVWHQGGLPGFGSYVLFLPERSWGVVALANTAENSNVAEETLVWHLLDDMLEVPLSDRLDCDDHYINPLFRTYGNYDNIQVRLDRIRST